MEILGIEIRTNLIGSLQQTQSDFFQVFNAIAIDEAQQFLHSFHGVIIDQKAFFV
jgi:hypothetical protein